MATLSISIASGRNAHAVQDSPALGPRPPRVQRLHCLSLAIRSATVALLAPRCQKCAGRTTLPGHQDHGAHAVQGRTALHPRLPGPWRPQPSQETNQMCNDCAALFLIVAAYQVEAACPDSSRPVSQTDNSHDGKVGPDDEPIPGWENSSPRGR